MIRLILFFIFALLIIIFSIPALLIGALWGKLHRPSRDVAVKAFVSFVFRTVNLIAGAKITAIGTENLPSSDEAVLYIGNHKSFFDILVSYIYLKGQTGYVAKKEMIKIPLLRTWMEYIYCLFLDRSDPKEGMKTILKAIEQVKNGVSVFIFPEGTRNPSDTLLDFKEGSFKIATKSGCRIVPVTINNSAALLENHFPTLKKAHVVIEFGTPIDIASLTPDEKKHIGAYTQNIIQNTYDKNKALV